MLSSLRFNIRSWRDLQIRKTMLLQREAADDKKSE